MKKLVLTIITIFVFFSIVNYSNAWYSQEKNIEWYMEKILDLNYGIEEYKFQVNEIRYVYFYNKNSQNLYDSFRSTEQALKEEFLRKYKNNEIDYYTMNGIVKNFNLFVYHSNKMFEYLSMKEYSNYKELGTAILKNYENSRWYFYKTKNLMK
jgi:hypothetical protein